MKHKISNRTEANKKYVGSALKSGSVGRQWETRDIFYCAYMHFLLTFI